MNKVTNIFLRYIIIIISGLGNLFIFYKIFTPLTVKAIALIFNAPAIQTTINLCSVTIEIIPACVAGSAYYLFLILNLTTPNIKIKKRITILSISFLALLIFNILRIVLLTLIAGSTYFESIHLFFWYGLSTIFVILTWILLVNIFKIKSIPVYTDFKYLYSLIKKRKKSKR